MIARNLALLALLVVPLVASGEAPDPPPSVMPKAMPAQSSERMKIVTYSVADLVAPIAGLDYPQEAREEEQTKTKEAWLMKKITTTVAPRTWSEFGGIGSIQYYPLGMALVVNQTPEIHALIEDLLTTMQRVQNVEVQVAIHVVTVKGDYFAELRQIYPELKQNGQVKLTEKQVQAFFKNVPKDDSFNVLQPPQFTIFSGQNCRIDVVNKLDVKLGATVACNLRHIDLDVKAEVFDVKFNKAARLVEGTTLVLSARKDKGTQVLFMVTPRVIINVGESVANLKPIPKATVQTTRDSGVVQASATVPNQVAVAPVKLSSEKQWVIKIGVYEGDPLGSREANTIRTIGEPTIMAPENQTFRCMAGVQAPIKFAVGNNLPEVSYVEAGLHVEGKVLNVKDGLAQIDLTISLSKLDNRGEENVRVHGESTRAVTRVKLGELVKIRVGRINLDQQRWVEMRVTEFPEPSVTAE